VENIAHVINYDLPQVAEAFIHRVGRTGRAGERGLASTLFGREERSDLLQLERTLGIRMERMQADDDASAPPVRTRRPDESVEPRRLSALVRLPGEVLQAQLA
jgi:ATP-dependent RNA helicase RhlE